MDPSPPQGDTWYCWAASVVCAAHSLGYDVHQYRSVEGVARLVFEYGHRIDQHAGMKHVVALASHLGLLAAVQRRADPASVKSTVRAGKRVIVNWNPSAQNSEWYSGQHMGAILRWENDVSVSDSYPAPPGETAALRTFAPPGGQWFRPKVAILSRR